MKSPLQDLKQVQAQCVKMRSWVMRLPPEVSDELHGSIDDIEIAVQAAIQRQEEEK